MHSSLPKTHQSVYILCLSKQVFASWLCQLKASRGENIFFTSQVGDYMLPGPLFQLAGMKHRLAALEKLCNDCYAKSSCSNEVVLGHQGMNPLHQFPIKHFLVKGSWLLQYLNEADEKRNNKAHEVKSHFLDFRCEICFPFRCSKTSHV